MEYSRQAYENYTQEMFDKFEIPKEDRISRNKVNERRSFEKNDPISQRRSQINNQVLGHQGDRYWYKDGNFHYGMNIGNL